MPTPSFRPRRVDRLALAAAVAAALLAGACTTPAPSTPPPARSDARTTLSDAGIEAVVAAPDRSPADRAIDGRRKPQQFLAFVGVRPGSVALDLSAGGGYTTELLARAIGPDGTVYGQSPPRDPAHAPPAPSVREDGAAPAAPAAPSMAASAAPPPRSSAIALAERDARLRAGHSPAAPIVVVTQPFESPVPAALAQQRLDLVTLVYDYHDLGFLGVDRARMNRAVFAALKPGGSYVIVDHAGRPGTGISESGTLHRIEEAFLRQEVEAAGFRVASEAAFLRNPADPRDRNQPEPPQPKDGFALKFVKP